MDEEKRYIRQVQTSVTLFLYHVNDYLFLKRDTHKRVDPGKLNGVGGRLEPGEDFLAAAIRETHEETGYKVAAKDVQLSAIVKLEGGYQEDWVMCFFRIRVPNKKIPKGNKTEDGELIWLQKDKVLNSEYNLIDDLVYTFDDIVNGKETVFMTAKFGDDQKIYDVSIGKLAR